MGSDVDLLAFFQRIGGIDDHLVLHTHAAQNLQRGAVIAADGDGAQMHLVVAADDSHARTFLAEEHGVDRQRDSLPDDARPEMNFPEGARQQASIFVGHVNFRQQACAWWGRWIPQCAPPCL